MNNTITVDITITSIFDAHNLLVLGVSDALELFSKDKSTAQISKQLYNKLLDCGYEVISKEEITS